MNLIKQEFQSFSLQTHMRKFKFKSKFLSYKTGVMIKLSLFYLQANVAIVIKLTVILLGIYISQQNHLQRRK